VKSVLLLIVILAVAAAVLVAVVVRGAPIIIGQFADNRYRPFDNRHRRI